ncbi:MAG TPA: hypothetical protein VID20_00505 [Sphingomicrobium sp.]|jgi:hypothetical protein
MPDVCLPNVIVAGIAVAGMQYLSADGSTNLKTEALTVAND